MSDQPTTTVFGLRRKIGAVDYWLSRFGCAVDDMPTIRLVMGSAKALRFDSRESAQSVRRALHCDGLFEVANL